MKYKIDLYFDDLRKRDNANYEKCLIDSMKGKIFEDDSQFKVTVIEQHYDPIFPRVEVQIFKYEMDKTMESENIETIKKMLGLQPEKEISPVCKRCYKLFYWINEGMVPNEDDRQICSNFMSKNLEFKCPNKPRKKIDPIIESEID